MSAARRISMILVATASAALAVPLLASPAHAQTKERSPLPPADGLVLTGVCDFPVRYTDVRGHATQTLVLDDDGDLQRIEIRSPGLRSELTNVETGESVTVNNSGPVTIVPQADGSFHVVQRGQSVTIDQGNITGVPLLLHGTGRIEITSVASSVPGVVDFTSQQRRGRTTDLCEVLAP